MSSAKFELIKGYYDAGLWNKAMVRNMVAKGKITTEEYAAITGEAYE